MKPLAVFAAIAALLGVYGLVDTIDRATEARVDFLRTADEKCLPLRPGESSIIVSDGRQMRCRVYIRNSPGMAPAIVSAAVMDIPQ